ncbi:MAG TPA: hypothetical protein VN222_10070 [Novosphingobium sp.]|nr:hypothetical protein [Novosphingobium sp.]
MIRTRSAAKGRFLPDLKASGLSGAAMAAAMMVGLGGGALLSATPAMAAAQPSYSKGFVAVAGPLQKAIEDAKKNPGDAAGMAALKAKLDAAIAASTSADDKFAVGNMAVQIGGMSQDPAVQRKGVKLMLESGKADPALAPKLHFYAGQFAFQGKEYAEARTEFQAALAQGYKDPEAQVLIAETYFQDHQDAQGLAELQKAIADTKAAGGTVPESWYRRALGATFGAKQYEAAAAVSAELVKAYPTKQNWSAAIAVVRDLGRLPSQDTIDLMRLMARTDSFAEERDYIEFVQSADARRNPGEVKTIIDRGVAAKMVDPSKQFFADALKIASARIAADKASLPGLEKDARAPAANAATVSGAADAFLSYDQSAKAVELYKLALSKPGVDKNVALTRLGIAQVDTGDYAGAQASFGQVDGVRKPMAVLWGVYAGQKGGAK